MFTVGVDGVTNRAGTSGRVGSVRANREVGQAPVVKGNDRSVVEVFHVPGSAGVETNLTGSPALIDFQGSVIFRTGSQAFGNQLAQEIHRFFEFHLRSAVGIHQFNGSVVFAEEVAVVAIEDLGQEEFSGNRTAPGGVGSIVGYQLSANILELIPGHGVVVVRVSNTLGVEQILVVRIHEHGIVVRQSVQRTGFGLLGGAVIAECVDGVGPNVVDGFLLCFVKLVIQS